MPGGPRSWLAAAVIATAVLAGAAALLNEPGPPAPKPPTVGLPQVPPQS